MMLLVGFFDVFMSFFVGRVCSERSVLYLAGQPAAASEGAAPLRQVSQAEPGSVPGPTRAAAAGHQHHLPGRLL